MRVLFRTFPGFVLAFRTEGRQPKHGEERGMENDFQFVSFIKNMFCKMFV